VSRLVISLDALKHNLSVVGSWMDQHAASWIVVTKALCGHTATLEALKMMGVQAVGDSRLDNLKTVGEVMSGADAWYLRGPSTSAVEDVVGYANVSLNSEIETIENLNAAAQAQEKLHGVVIMVELGDLREGILPGGLVRFYEQVFKLSNINVLGIGANLGCLAGAVPTVDQLMQLVLYRELLELKFQQRLPLISAGTTAVLPLLLEGQVPDAVNHFRVGEALFLGTDLINGGTLPYLRDDVVTLEAEISEIKEKGLAPMVETAPVSRLGENDDEDSTPGQRGYRALVNVGHLDTDVDGLTPVEPGYRIAGASSDITVVNLGEDPDGLSVGDSIRFKANYSGLLRLMSGKYTEKVVDPPLAEFALRQAETAPAVRQLPEAVGADRQTTAQSTLGS
jgi:predicted amino acid racemase